MIWSQRDIRPQEKFAGNIILRNIADADRRHSVLDSLRNPIKKVEPHILQSKKDELLLGALDDDYTEPATIPYNGNSFGMLIVAQRGDGKTQLVKHIICSQLYERFGYSLFLVDPKNDYSNLNQATKEPELIEKMQKFGIRAHGFQAEYFKPAYANLKDRPGTEYIVTFRDFDSLDYGRRAEALSDAFYPLSDVAQRSLQNLLSGGFPKSAKTLFEKLKKYRIDTVKERERLAKDAGLRVPPKVASSALDMIITDKIKQGIVGDDGQSIVRETDEDENGKIIVVDKVKANAASFANELAKNGRPNIVVFNCDLTLEKSVVSSFYLKMAMISTFEDRRKFVDSKGKEGVMWNGLFYVIDEGDVVIPRERMRYSPSREVCNQVLSKGRQFRLGEIVITQQPQMISQEYIRHVDYVVSTRIQSDETAKLVKEKYALQDYQVEELRHLRYNKNDSTKQWFCCTGNPENPYIIFEVLPPQVAIKKE